MRSSSPPAGSRRPEWMALGGLLLFTMAAVLGFGVYGLHPERLPSTPFAMAVFGRSFTLFGRVHIGLTVAVLAFAVSRAAGARWWVSAVAVAALSFVSEHLGTGYGFPFGAYSYSDLLGYKLGGRVPLLIPLSWFVMAAPSYALASRVFPGTVHRGARIVGASVLLVSWDLALDPAMSFLTRYWIWGEPGPFYGMPLVNLGGWFFTGVVLMAALEATGASGWTAAVPVRWWMAFYGTVLLMPLGMVVAGGLWGSAVATLAALGACALVARARVGADEMVHEAAVAAPRGAEPLSWVGGGR